MKSKILSIEEAISYLKGAEGSKVLVGGCFDILHKGHLVFLEKAKKEGDILVVILESDQNIRKLKGKDRPINTQENRAKVLASLKDVDLVVTLPKIDSDNDYDDLVMKLKPDVIATTEGDKGIRHKIRQAKLTGAKLVEVTERVEGFSSSDLIGPKSA